MVKEIARYVVELAAGRVMTAGVYVICRVHPLIGTDRAWNIADAWIGLFMWLLGVRERKARA